MRIRTVKKLNLPELIQYVWENGISYQTFHPTADHLAFGEKVFGITVNTGAKMNGKAKIHLEGANENNVLPYVYYVVETEEELTEDMEIHGATLVYYNQLKKEVKTFKYSNEVSPTIEHMIQKRSGTEALALFKGNQLMWTKENGIPESGVLEVSV